MLDGSRVGLLELCLWARGLLFPRGAPGPECCSDREVLEVPRVVLPQACSRDACWLEGWSVPDVLQGPRVALTEGCSGVSGRIGPIVLLLGCASLGVLKG